MDQLIGTIALVFLVLGGVVLTNNAHMDFVEGLVTWLFLTAVPYLIAWAILKRKAPFMLFFYKHHPHFRYWEMLGWFIISLIWYFYAAGQMPKGRNSLANLCAMSVIAVPFNVFLWVMVMLDKRFQAWAMQEMQNIVGNKMTAQHRPSTMPDGEWKPPMPPENQQADNVFQFDKDKFKRD